MKVFICWSDEGSASHKAAQALHRWIKSTFDGVQPFLSSSDVSAGEVWGTRLGGELKETTFGIACVTPASKDSTWMHYEAGAIAKLVEDSKLVPLVLGLRATDLSKPLGRFNAAVATEAALRELAAQINAASSGRCLDDETLRQRFDAFWPALDKSLKEAVVLAEAEPHQKPRSADSMVEEILELTRAIHRQTAPANLTVNVPTGSVSLSDIAKIATKLARPAAGLASHVLAGGSFDSFQPAGSGMVEAAPLANAEGKSEPQK
jgi:hypothetical protein